MVIYRFDLFALASPSNKTVKIIRSVALLSIVILFSGCASTKTGTLSSGQAIVDVSLIDVQSDENLPLYEPSAPLPDSFDAVDNARAVRWGGTITRIDNLPDQRTLLELVSRPLHNNGRPIHNDKSEGRFVAYFNQFLDPEIIEIGRDITLRGLVVARQAGAIGETDYVFPLMSVEDYTFWKEQVITQPPRFSARGRYSGRRSDPFWDGWILRRPGKL